MSRGGLLTDDPCRACLGGSDCFTCPDNPLSVLRSQGSVMFLGRVRELDEDVFTRMALHAMDESKEPGFV